MTHRERVLAALNHEGARPGADRPGRNARHLDQHRRLREAQGPPRHGDSVGGPQPPVDDRHGRGGDPRAVDVDTRSLPMLGNTRPRSASPTAATGTSGAWCASNPTRKGTSWTWATLEARSRSMTSNATRGRTRTTPVTRRPRRSRGEASQGDRLRGDPHTAGRSSTGAVDARLREPDDGHCGRRRPHEALMDKIGIWLRVSSMIDAAGSNADILLRRRRRLPAGSHGPPRHVRKAHPVVPRSGSSASFEATGEDPYHSCGAVASLIDDFIELGWMP